MYGIKGYIFFENEKFPFERPPFEAMTGYDKGNEFVETLIQSLEIRLKNKENAPKATGYMFILTKGV